MTILLKYYKYLISMTLIIIAFAYGRYSAQKPETKTTITAKETSQEHKNEVVHTQTQTVATKALDGTTKTVTTTDTVSTTKSASEDRRSEDIKELTAAVKPKINLSLLTAYDFSDRNIRYGVSINKELVGPITGGLWVTSDGTLGLSIGVNF